MRYTSWRDRLDWKQRADEPIRPLTQARQRILPMEEQIFKQLLPMGHDLLPEPIPVVDMH